MNWMNILQELFEVAIFPILGALALYAITLINTKKEELKSKTDNQFAKKYLDMFDKTITNCVLATQQTYVKTLKEQGKFNAEAQKVAFQRTFDNIMGILSEESKTYLSNMIGDVALYTTEKMESEIIKLKPEVPSETTIAE